MSWDDVGALHEIRKELSNYVIQPIKCPERFKKVGLDAPSGILLYGPPGCGMRSMYFHLAHSLVKERLLLRRPFPMTAVRHSFLFTLCSGKLHLCQGTRIVEQICW